MQSICGIKFDFKEKLNFLISQRHLLPLVFRRVEHVASERGRHPFAYLYLDPANPPQEAMMQWYDGASWEHAAYWGANLIPWGADGTVSQRPMGTLPATGQWMKLEVPASAVGLEGRTVSGMNFVLYSGRATWDAAGK